MKITILKVIYVAIIFLIGFATLTKVNFLDYESPIKYKNINQITFKNFRGLEFFQNSLYGNKSFAYVKTTIEYELDNDSITIEALFHPSSSYVYNKNVYSEDLLRHEMYHFKITEFFSRLAKSRISKLKKHTENNIENIISEIKKEERIYQSNYDNDTFHSYVLSEQKKYEKDIDSLLFLHDNFKKSKIPYNEKQ